MAIAEGQNTDQGGADQKPVGGTPSPDGKAGAADQQASQQDKGQRAAGDPPPQDRRDAGLLRDLQRERQERQRIQKEHADLQAKLDLAEKRTRALVGVEPQSEEEAEIADIRAKFTKVFPALAKLNDEQLVEALTGQLENSSRSQSFEDQYWNERAEQMTDAVVQNIAEELGVEELSERQQTRIRAAYAHKAATDPDFLRRHERGDKKLAAEFAKEFLEDWIEPARKRVTQEEARRLRPVPGDGGKRHIGAKKPRTIDFKNEKDVADAMVESFRSHGGEFGS